MSEQWVLVPVKATAGMIDALLIPDDADDEPMTWSERFAEAIAAAPPMPRATFDAMVERAARATFLMRNGSKTCWAWDSSGLDDEHPGARERYLKDAETALRAALPGLQVEGE